MYDCEQMPLNCVFMSQKGSAHVLHACARACVASRADVHQVSCPQPFLMLSGSAYVRVSAYLRACMCAQVRSIVLRVVM